MATTRALLLLVLLLAAGLAAIPRTASAAAPCFIVVQGDLLGENQAVVFDEPREVFDLTMALEQRGAGGAAVSLGSMAGRRWLQIELLWLQPQDCERYRNRSDSDLFTIVTARQTASTPRVASSPRC